MTIAPAARATRNVAARNFPARAEERNVDFCEGCVAEFLDLDPLSAKLDRSSE